ncbi:MAG: HAMP domain-containing histidine kinase [Actinomycetia bacterium]|nr:HAMP domain-containing histidine kinase [Actinomycetes bacterium]
MVGDFDGNGQLDSQGKAKKIGSKTLLWTRSLLYCAAMVFLVALFSIGFFASFWAESYDFSELFGTFVTALLAMLLGVLAFVPLIGYLSRPLKEINWVLGQALEGKLDARTNMEGNDLCSSIGKGLDGILSDMQQLRAMEDRITNDVIHELRSPLSAAQATLEGMIDGVLAVDRVRLLTLNHEIIRLSKLVNDQLDLTRLESGRTRLQRYTVNLAQMAEDMVSTYQLMVEDAGLFIECHTEPNVTVMGDVNLLSRALANLLSNATRYTLPGGRIIVTVYSEDAQAKITVADTGVGIKDEHLDKIFSRFWRADYGRSRESGGLGLGLAMVKEIVSRHGGTIDVESTVDKGSAFKITLPLVASF